MLGQGRAEGKRYRTEKIFSPHVYISLSHDTYLLTPLYTRCGAIF